MMGVGTVVEEAEIEATAELALSILSTYLLKRYIRVCNADLYAGSCCASARAYRHINISWKA